jgi:hypothetical protein
MQNVGQPHSAMQGTDYTEYVGSIPAQTETATVRTGLIISFTIQREFLSLDISSFHLLVFYHLYTNLHGVIIYISEVFISTCGKT